MGGLRLTLQQRKIYLLVYLTGKTHIITLHFLFLFTSISKVLFKYCFEVLN